MERGADKNLVIAFGVISAFITLAQLMEAARERENIQRRQSELLARLDRIEKRLA